MLLTMGRHKKVPTTDGSVVKESAFNAGTYTESEAVLDRLGFNDNVCMDCNARNAASRDNCRKCGSTSLRQKRRDFYDS